MFWAMRLLLYQVLFSLPDYRLFILCFVHWARVLIIAWRYS